MPTTTKEEELKPRFKDWDGVYVSGERGFLIARKNKGFAGVNVNGKEFTETIGTKEYTLVAKGKRIHKEVKTDAVIFKGHATIDVFGHEKELFTTDNLARLCEVFELRNFFGKVIGIRLKVA